jgi:cysteine rich repeat protein
MCARPTVRFTTIVAASLLTISAIPSVVLAQKDLVGVVFKACASDLRQCPGSGEVRRACVKVHFKEFSLPCQLALVKAAAIRKACKGDVKKNCADVAPGSGRIEACMKDHFADVSEGCKETISQAAGKS